MQKTLVLLWSNFFTMQTPRKPSLDMVNRSSRYEIFVSSTSSYQLRFSLLEFVAIISNMCNKAVTEMCKEWVRWLSFNDTAADSMV